MYTNSRGISNLRAAPFMEAEKGTLEFGAWSLALGVWRLEFGALEFGAWSLVSRLEFGPNAHAHACAKHDTAMITYSSLRALLLVLPLVVVPLH